MTTNTGHVTDGNESYWFAKNSKQYQVSSLASNLKLLNSNMCMQLICFHNLADNKQITYIDNKQLLASPMLVSMQNFRWLDTTLKCWYMLCIIFPYVQSSEEINGKTLMCLMFYLVSQFSACLVPTLVAFQTPHYSYNGKTFYMFIRIDTIKISFFLPKMLELV